MKYPNNSTGLDAIEQETLVDLERLAARLERQAYEIRCAVAYCIRNETTQGLGNMVAFSFNAQQYSPQYGGTGGLPAGPNGENVKYPVMITASVPVDTKDNFGNAKGFYLAFELTVIDGPLKGGSITDRLNLGHKEAKIMEIANKQLSAYCHVLGKFSFQATEELHNIPFVIEVGLQKVKPGDEDKGYTEVKKLYDINGNEPGKAGSGPQNNPQQQQNNPPPNSPPAGGVQPQGGGWGGNAGGQPNPQVDNNVPPPNQQQQPQNNPGGGGGWGQPQNGQGSGWGGGQPNQQQPAPQDQQQNNGGGSPGWGGGQAGGSPGWGQR